MTPWLTSACLLLAPPSPLVAPPEPLPPAEASPVTPAAEDAPLDPELAAARVELSRGRWAAARERLVQLRDTRPDDALVRNELGVALFQEGAYRAAVAELERAVALDPARANAWANLGEARRRAGDSDGGAQAFAKALALQPDDAAAQAGRARCLADLGRMDDARVQLTEHPERDTLVRELERQGTPSAFALLERARAAVVAGDAPRASLLVDRVLRVAPESADALAMRALIAALVGDPASARADVAHALALDPRCHLAQEVLFVVEDLAARP